MLKQQEAKMTFHFQNLPFWDAADFLPDDYGRGNPLRRRFRLIARWQRGADGHLECRWLRRPMNFLSD
jgi:hypothetical protein